MKKYLFYIISLVAAVIVFSGIVSAQSDTTTVDTIPPETPTADTTPTVETPQTDVTPQPEVTPEPTSTSEEVIPEIAPTPEATTTPDFDISSSVATSSGQSSVASTTNEHILINLGTSTTTVEDATTTQSFLPSVIWDRIKNYLARQNSPKIVKQAIINEKSIRANEALAKSLTKLLEQIASKSTVLTPDDEAQIKKDIQSGDKMNIISTKLSLLRTVLNMKSPASALRTATSTLTNIRNSLSAKTKVANKAISNSIASPDLIHNIVIATTNMELLVLRKEFYSEQRKN